jgi:hypothetical protein
MSRIDRLQCWPRVLAISLKRLRGQGPPEKFDRACACGGVCNFPGEGCLLILDIRDFRLCLRVKPKRAGRVAVRASGSGDGWRPALPPPAKAAGLRRGRLG